MIGFLASLTDDLVPVCGCALVESTRGVAMDATGSDEARIARVRAALGAAGKDPALSLCQVSASIVQVAGAGVILISGGRTVGSVCVSNAMTEAVEEVQYTLGEGPCMDAFSSKVPVLVPDLASSELHQWSGFRLGIAGFGIRAAFGFPLLVGPICIGALNLYHDRPGELSRDQYGDAVIVAHLVARSVLGWQSAAEAGTLAWQLEQVPSHRAVIHQAAGMVSVQAGVAVGDGLDLLRAHAFAEGRPIGQVATDVVDRHLRFEP
jgi:GAF domain/ANTAR domain